LSERRESLFGWVACRLGLRDISGPEARELVAQGALLVDVRTPWEYGRGHLPGALNVPVGEIAERVEELRRGLPVVVYCAAGVRSRSAAEILRRAGVEPVHNLGTPGAWSAD
jgi:rhodanese-related sulfurtransferase